MKESENSTSENCMNPGQVSWNELTTSDPAAALRFYTALFGWTTEKFPASGMDYTMVLHDGKAFGGVMAAPAGGPTQWVNYVVVEDVDATVAKSLSLGGKTCLEPNDIPMVGRIAVIQDPQGATIGLHKPSASM